MSASRGAVWMPLPMRSAVTVAAMSGVLAPMTSQARRLTAEAA
jgi:hypothetical protein